MLKTHSFMEGQSWRVNRSVLFTSVLSLIIGLLLGLIFGRHDEMHFDTKASGSPA
jgi:hypothetical protein